MFKKALIATATASMIAAGSLIAATSTASAHGPGGPGGMQFGGPGWSFQFGFGPSFQNHPQRFCRPIVKNVKWWDRWGRPHWKQVVVGNNCRRGPHQGPGGPGFPGGLGPGMGPGWGGGW